VTNRSKCGSSDRSDTGGMKQRKTTTLEEILDVSRRYECNKHTTDTVNDVEIPKLTLRTISKQSDEIKESLKSAMMMMASNITQIRVLL
jgi:hypothetical protein